MKTKIGLALLPLLLACATAPAAASTPVTTSPAGSDTGTTKTVPELYAGELDDIGPQYLVLEAPRRPTRFSLWGRADLCETDNATYSEDDPSSSSLSNLQLGLDARCWSRELGSKSVLRLDAGVRGQAFRYGLFGDSDKVIDYLEVNRNNFDLLGGHLRLAWQRGPWLAEAVTSATWMESSANDRTFYREVAQGIAVYRQFTLPRDSVLYVGADIGRRWSRTYSYGLLPGSWNDRYEASVLAMVAMPLGKTLAWRNVLRAHWADYSHRDRDRRDLIGTFMTDLSWKIIEGVELHVQATHERRDTTGVGMPDYSRWEVGTGCHLRWHF